MDRARYISCAGTAPFSGVVLRNSTGWAKAAAKFSKQGRLVYWTALLLAVTPGYR